MQPITSTELKLLSHRQQVQFAIFCAKQVEAKWKNEPACVAAIATTEAWLEGKATEEECRKAAYNSYAISAASWAAYAVAYTSKAAVYASNAANDAVSYVVDKQSCITAQWNYFYTLLGELGKVLYF